MKTGTVYEDKLSEEYAFHKSEEDYEAKKAAGTLKTRPISELWDEIDL